MAEEPLQLGRERDHANGWAPTCSSQAGAGFIAQKFTSAFKLLSQVQLLASALRSDGPLSGRRAAGWTRAPAVSAARQASRQASQCH